MPSFKMTNFKTGTNPNPRFMFDMKNLTGKQKLELVYCRIWGTNIGDGMRSGSNYLRKKVPYVKAHLYDLAIEKQMIPWLDDYSVDMDRKLKTEERRKRILMRGVKIGRRKTIGSTSASNIFDKKTKPSDSKEPNKL